VAKVAAEAGSKTLYLVDGTSQLFRAYFALPRLSNAEGLPTHAVYGFTTMLRKLMNDEKPEHLAVAFDLPGGTFRHDRYAEYKANRPPAPEDLNVQVPFAKDVCRALRIPVLELAGYEADDLIATYARLAREDGFEVVVVASDKDLLQLVGAGVRVFNPVKETWLDPDATRETFGVPPALVADVLGLMGDSVDNIPGVPGVGEKTALAMVRGYGGLESIVARARRFVALCDARDAVLELLEAAAKEAPLSEPTASRLGEALARLSAALDDLIAHEADPEYRSRLETLAQALASAPSAEGGEPGRAVAGKFRDVKRDLKALERGSSRRAWYAVHENAEQARLSRELATLDHDVPVTFDAPALAVGPPDRDKARALFHGLGFRGLVAGLDQDSPPEQRPAATMEPRTRAYRTASTPESLAGLAASAREQGRIALQVLGDLGDPLRATLRGVAIAAGDGPASWIPVSSRSEGPDLEALRAGLATVMKDPGTSKVAHDLKHALKLLSRHGLEVEGWGLDTRVAAFLLDPGRPRLDIEALSAEYLGQGIETPRTVDAGEAVLPLDPDAEDPAAAGAATVAQAVLPLSTVLEERLRQAGLEALYRTIDGPLLPVLARMELSGIRVDAGVLGSMSTEMQSSMDRLRSEIHGLAGVEFNVDSPKQLREVLFERLGFAPKHKTAKSKVSSTDARTLEELGTEHPIARKILEYRELAKLKGTYADTLPQLIHPETGRVHTTYDPAGAATGRLSSVDPNLQNIPARSEAGLRIRAAFVPENGFVFLSSDYSQVELRILAHLTGDPELIAAFGRGDDIHRHTASLVYGVDPDLVSDAMRTRAKAVNFGIVYGMSEIRLAAEQGMARGEARQFIRAYFERFGSIRTYIERIREEVRRDGSVRTMFGRVRRFPQLRERVNRAVQEQALRAAVNTTVQGTAADLMKMAMLRVDRALREAGLAARMLLQVHDELLFEVPVGQIDDTRAVVRTALERVHELAVPLVVDQKVGASWKEVT
jgi:DNA polymerase-1